MQGKPTAEQLAAIRRYELTAPPSEEGCRNLIMHVMSLRHDREALRRRMEELKELERTYVGKEVMPKSSSGTPAEPIRVRSLWITSQGSVFLCHGANARRANLVSLNDIEPVP